jgi:hypothetical protein
MNRTLFSAQLRRDFLLRGLPICAMAGLGMASLPLLGQAPAPQPAQPAHKFDTEIPRKLTYRLAFRMQYASAYIPFLEHLSKALGRDKVIEILKAYSTEAAGPNAAATAKAMGGNDFTALKKFFSLDNKGYANMLTFTVAQSDDKVHELHATECLWARTFLDAKAGDLGYAGICFGDYQFAKAFNPQIEMLRDKTLMQGHDCCNHRYIWKG